MELYEIIEKWQKELDNINDEETFMNEHGFHWEEKILQVKAETLRPVLWDLKKLLRDELPIEGRP